MGTTALTLAGLPYDIVSILALSVRMVAGIALFSWQLPRREGFARRVAAISCLWLAGAAAFVAAGLTVPDPGPVGSAFLQLTLFSMVLLACTASVYALFEASVWVALFCSTAGYTVQNLASGTGELIFALLPLVGVDPRDPMVALVTWALTAWRSLCRATCSWVARSAARGSRRLRTARCSP